MLQNKQSESGSVFHELICSSEQRKRGMKKLGKNKNRIKRVALCMLVFLLAVSVFHGWVVYKVNHTLTHRQVTITEQSINERDALMPHEEKSASKEVDLVVPFQEVDVFDDNAHCWSNWASQKGAAGALAFDANNDGRTDLYFPQDGQNWTRATDANGELLDAPRFQKNELYLNRGNRPDGTPIFMALEQLVKANDTFVAEELLIEDYLYPRKSADDSQARWGRSSNAVVAADFNNDGRLDVLIGNEPQGMEYSAKHAQMKLGRFVNPQGREERQLQFPVDSRGLHLISYQPKYSLSDTRASARGTEAEGANSLYLNMGDQDHDGLPEWQDASRATGLEGFRPTYSISVADFDLDGDLDIYTGNTMDLDYFPGGAKTWAGGANCLYVNQLVETGTLVFIEQAAKMNVDGVYDKDYPPPSYERLRRLPWVPKEYSLLFPKIETFRPKPMRVDGKTLEQGQITWATLVQDVDEDGYPDIWVANDFGFLRLYRNQKGVSFKLQTHARKGLVDNYMTFAAADFNGDTKEDVFVGNVGGGVWTEGVIAPNVYEFFEPNFTASRLISQIITGKSKGTHALLDGAHPERELCNSVRHSRVLPPDASLPGNVRRYTQMPNASPQPFDPRSLDPCEFAWGAAAFDVQNDGKMDLYFCGGMLGRGGGILSFAGTGPGRLLINDTPTGSKTVAFADLTAEHHVFNILELKYDKLQSEGYIYRPSPSQNWVKRDTVHSFDRGSWISQGPGIKDHVVNHDLIQTAENGRAVLAADLNHDGFPDLLIRNHGGYDSRSSKATNLKTRVHGRVAAVPGHNPAYPDPTSYEPGRTRLFINRYQTGNWIKIRLRNKTKGTYNRFAIGAKILVNGKFLRINRASQGGYLGSTCEDLLIGLGTQTAQTVEVTWPNMDRSVSHYPLADLKSVTIVIEKEKSDVEILPSPPVSRKEHAPTKVKFLNDESTPQSEHERPSP